MQAENYTAPDTPEMAPVAVVRTNRFAVTLANARLTVPVSQGMVGQLIGVRTSAVCNWERGLCAPSLLTAAHIARLLSIPDELRAFSPARPPVVMRADLRSINPGCDGYYDRSRIRPIPAGGERRAVAMFRRLVAAECGRRGLDPAQVAIRAGVPPNQVSAVVGPGNRRVGLLAAARVADALGLTVTLESFAGPDVQPLPPVAGLLN